MMKNLLLVCLAFLCASIASAQITLSTPATIPSINGNYTSLTKANGVFAALNGKVFLGGSITITVTGNVTDENGAVQLNNNGWSNISMQPSGGSFTLSGNVNGSMIVLNGADYVTINGLNTGGNALTFSNTAVNSLANTITFTNDASFNTVTNCSIYGSGSSNTNGTVYFGTRTALVGVGNDDNTISNCNIGPAGVSLPVNGIFSSGTYTAQGIMNSNNTISNNNIYDFFSPVQNTAGIYLHYGNHNWTINNNRLYQTAPRTFTSNAGNVYAGIKLDAGFPGTTSAEGNNFIITNNRIGFANSSGTGVTTISGTGVALQNKIRALDLINVATSVATSVQGNVISGFNQTTSYSNTAATEGCFVAMMLGSSGTGRYDVGNVAGNTIGSLDGSSGIVINQASVTVNNAKVVGIVDYTNSSNNISNNNIGSITIQGAGTTTGFSGIFVNTATTATSTITQNTIGGSNSAGAINNLQVGNYSCFAIYTNQSTVTLTGNTIRNINTHSTDAGFVVLSGITCSGSTGVNTISQNHVHSLSNDPGLSNPAIYAMDLSLPVTNNVVEKNRVHSLECIGNASSQVVGIFARGGRATYQNNVVRLGINKSGASITLGSPFYGIWNASAVADNRFYNNTVYIGGTGVIGGSPTTCLYGSVIGTFARYYQNNNLVNLRTPASGTALNLGIRFEGSAITGITSNYNNIQTGPGSYTGVFNSNIYTTLAAWQASTALDAISVDGDPLFVNANGDASTLNLNIQVGSICNNEGLRTSPAVADDINAVARNNSSPVATPDIGAYELVRGTSPGTWIGVIDSDWNKPGNWDNGVVPTSFVDVHIIRGHKVLGGSGDQPVITTGNTASCRNINLLLPVSSVVVNAGTIRVAGAISNRGLLNLTNGTLDLNGTATQSFAGSRFYQHSINNLVISNVVNLIKDTAPNDTLNITGALSFTGSGRSFNLVSAGNPTYGQLTLKSSSTTTAYVADITNAGTSSGNAINGNVTIERYIHTPRKWQLLSVPANTTQTINAAWQEGLGANVMGPVGFGTAISGPNGAGMDFYSPSHSMKWWNGTNYNNVTNTGASIGTNKDRAYFVYVRGDRSINTSTSVATNNTTLRVTGPLNQNGYTPALTIPSGQQVTVANPYAAPIDFTSIRSHSNIDNQFQVWDPKLQGLYTAGGFVSFSSATAIPFEPVPAIPGSYTAGVANTRIESGQGFFVRRTAATGNISFAETDKISGSRSVNRNPVEISNRYQFNTALYAISNGTALLVDGNAVVFSEDFKNVYDENDADKMSNGSDNFSIRKTDGSPLLIIDARNEMNVNDTIYFNHQGQFYTQYRLALYTTNFDTAVKAWLVDNFLQTSTPLNITDTSYYNFSFTSNAASRAADRFKVVFKAPPVPPMSFVQVDASRQADLSVAINWKVKNASKIVRYEVQRSADSTYFDRLAQEQTIATSSLLYNTKDALPLSNDNYYRIKAIHRNGDMTISAVIKVAADQQVASVAVTPNPVVNKQMKLRFVKQPVAWYGIELTNMLGQQVYNNKIRVDGLLTVKTISLNNSIGTGKYQLVVRDSRGEVLHAETIIIE